MRAEQQRRLHGLTATFAVTVVNPVAAGVTLISNTASIADDGANGADSTPGNNSSSDTTPVTAAPDFSVTKSDSGASVAPGGTVSYTLTYANSGNQGATGVVLTETVPARPAVPTRPRSPWPPQHKPYRTLRPLPGPASPSSPPSSRQSASHS